MKPFYAKAEAGILTFGKGRDRMIKDLLENEGARYVVERLTPESSRMRAYFEGAVIPLFVYLDGNDYKDPHVINYYRENYIKPEFNGEMVVIQGKPVKVGKSTKGELKELTDRLIDWMEEQYGIDRTTCLQPEDYKKFRDTIYPFTDFETYIDYLIEVKKLPAVYLKHEK